MDNIKTAWKSDENTKVVMKENEDSWIKSTTHALITCFYKKLNKRTENNNNSNRHEGWSEDVDAENEEYEEELVKQRREETENKFLCEVDHEKLLKNIRKRKQRKRKKTVTLRIKFKINK